ncbi:MAG TPA: alpha/beta hydrolase [Bryobacteraceae bacterium]|jgi:pimeloyl-ACP methyl ester carboxylesterase
MLRWLKRALWTLLAFLAVAGLAGFVYQNVATSRDQARFHPPGRMIDIGGGRRLNINCQGSGSPIVILESGLGVPSTVWARVLDGVKPLTRVCTYDRAGYGYSDAGPMPRTTDAIVGDLEKLLPAAGENGPYLLVGHSFGGFTIRVFTARHRSDVAGMIFVDSSHPEQAQRVPAAVRRKQIMLNWASQPIPWLCRIGVVRAAYAWIGSPAENTYLESQPKYTSAVISELNRSRSAVRKPAPRDLRSAISRSSFLPRGKRGRAIRPSTHCGETSCSQSSSIYRRRGNRRSSKARLI